MPENAVVSNLELYETSTVEINLEQVTDPSFPNTWTRTLWQKWGQLPKPDDFPDKKRHSHAHSDLGGRSSISSYSGVDLHRKLLNQKSLQEENELHKAKKTDGCIVYVIMGLAILAVCVAVVAFIPMMLRPSPVKEKENPFLVKLFNATNFMTPP